MKILNFIILCLICAINSHSQNLVNGTNLFDFNWKFHLGGAQSAENIGFDDSKWRTLDLPHDWSIEDLTGTQSPFNQNAISQVSGGFTTGGTGWYRKVFRVTPDQSSKKIIIQFDGVYMNADVWVNGQFLGNHPYGYTSFWYDMTDKIKSDADNVIAVKVKNEGENSRWYSGSGIYRHVWLKIIDPVHVKQWGTNIVTSEVSASSANVSIKTKVVNQSSENQNINIITKIFNPKGAKIAEITAEQSLEKSAEFEFVQPVIIANPDLWNLDNPALYTAVTEIYREANLLDKVETKFGIRTIKFDVTAGFQLNGKTIKLKGGCFHLDHGPLGTKSYDRAEERRVELLKASGYNAIRCSHNPPSPAFLDACDRLGMLVIDESFDTWQYPKNPNDYNLYFNIWWQKDLESMVLKDRNHPSIILWSIGNEIAEANKPEVVKTAQLQADFIHKLDLTRLITAAVNGLNPDKDLFFATLDIAGYNYGSGGDHMKSDIFDIDHKRIPSRIMIQTESYPLEAFKSWMDVEDHSWLLGDFVWTAFDYIGEASIGWLGYMQTQDFYPWNLAFCGDLDICGWKRPQSYYRDALWKTDQLSIFVKPPKPSFTENPNRMFWSKWHWLDAVADWNWAGFEKQDLQVSVYSSCEEVELFLNNKSLGKKVTNRSTEFKAIWDVTFKAGELKAIGYRNKKQVNGKTLQTANDVKQIKLTADRSTIKANNQDLSYITIELTDEKGILNPKAENLLKFEIEGPGTIVGVGNANPISVESYQLLQRKVWQGKCLVIIKSNNKAGKIKLNVSSEGLGRASVEIESML